MTTSALPENVQVVSRLAEDDQGYDITDAARYAALFRAEENHYWHVTRNELIARGLRRLGVTPPQRVLDIGCGGGCVTRHLASVGYAIDGVDGHERRICEAAARTPAARFFVHDLRRGVGELPAGYAAAGLFDVIEHLDEPVAALTEALGRVEPGGLVVGTVPALMSLWSEVDVISGHRLRYDEKTLRETLERVPGAKIAEVRWFNRALVPAVWASRRGKSDAGKDLERDLSVPPAPANWLLTNVLRVDHALDGAYSLFGLSGASLWFALRRATS